MNGQPEPVSAPVTEATISDAMLELTRAIERAFSRCDVSPNDTPENLVAVGHGVVLALDSLAGSFSRIADSLEKMADSP